MAFKNFVFGENWVGSKVAGIKTTFLPFLTQPGPTHILAPKMPKYIIPSEVF